MLFFQLSKLAIERVVFPVPDGRIVEDVIAIVVRADLAQESRVPCQRLCRCGHGSPLVQAAPRFKMARPDIRPSAVGCYPAGSPWPSRQAHTPCPPQKN